jgi:hypothetical protein
VNATTLAALAIAVVVVLAILVFTWFRAYRYTEAWRKGEFRAAALGFLVFFGGLFGHRMPPPPQARIESIGKARVDRSDDADRDAGRAEP